MKRLLLIILSLVVLVFGFSYIFNHWVQKDATGDPQTLAEAGQFVDLGDVRYHVTVSGIGGRTFVMLHDWGDSSATWKKTAELLAKQHTVVTVDLAGFGFSEKSSRVNYRLEARVEQLARLLQTMKFSNVTMVGSGYGATVAMAFGKEYPELTKSQVLIGPEILLHKTKFPTFLYNIPEVSRAGIKLAYSEKRQETALQQNISDPNAITSLRITAYTNAYTLQGIEDALLAMYKQKDTKTYVHSEMGTLPTLIIWGEKDRVVPRADMERMRADMVDVTLVTVPDAGHYVQDDAPEVVASAIQNFGLGR